MNIFIKITKKKWGLFLLIASLSCIFVATIYPFRFTIPPEFSLKFIFREFHFGSSIKDYIQNVLLFIPFGVSIAKVISTKGKTIVLWRIITISFIFSAIFSSIVELTQFFITIRTSNLTDIIYNSFGGSLGSFIYSYWQPLKKFTWGILTGKSEQLNIKTILSAIALYCSLVTLGIWFLLINVNLSNWDNNFYLAIGNEVTGDRPWNGRISSVQFSDRSLSPLAIGKLLNLPINSETQLASLISFDFSKWQEVYQDSQRNINLFWQDNISDSYQNLSNQTIIVDANHWLKSEQPVKTLTKQLKQTNEFTLYLSLATNQLNQTGPARILALSQGTKAHNLIVGQAGNNLEFRLRTPITGNSASQPEFTIPNVFNDLSLHKIIITFGNKKIDFYIDNIANHYSFKFQANNSFFIYFPWDKKNWKLNLQDYNIAKDKLIFNLIIVTPLIILFSLLIKLITKTRLAT
ncbi:hypothetical protein NIES4102_13570 [Chondrocystis sp. NIES-4102]|nr:hypothetical protein NIES4102_13570 [Chondrocystis sp. NIES-4102]